MVGIRNSRAMVLLTLLLTAMTQSACVSTEALYAEYDAFDCNIVASTDATGATTLHEQNTDTRYPWEPAVYFDFDSSELSATEQDRLNRSMQILKEFPSLSLGLQGFTDKRGTLNYNKALAERRVMEVKQYLEQAGIESSRVVVQPIGEVLAQVDADDSTARAVNRRVELMLLDDVGRPMPLNYAMK